MHYDYNTAKLISSEKNCGFWQCNDLCFFNKMECLKYATTSPNKTVTFHYFDEIFSSYNWKTEPIETLNELYKERAIQLRENNEHLVLMVSGGADSTNMLQSFLKNNIKIDEIVSVFPLKAIDKLNHTFDSTDKNPNNWMFEYTHAALPLLQQIATYHPQIKITVLDYIDETLYIIGNNNFYKLARPNGIINFASGFIHRAFEYVKSLKKNSTILYAIDKPKISYDGKQKKWYCRFSDFHANYSEFSYETFGGDQPKIEYFYYTPDLPKIVIKQCALIKKFLESASLVENPTSQLYKELITERTFKGQSTTSLDLYAHHNIIKKILYNDWNTEVYQANKGSSVFYNENFCSWFYRSNSVTQRIIDYHEGQLIEQLSGIDPYFLDYMKDGRPARLKFYSTKFYEL